MAEKTLQARKNRALRGGANLSTTDVTFSDLSEGELYRHLRLSQLEGSFDLEIQWRSQLPKTRKRCLKQLLNHERLLVGFDKLLEIPGLWHGMRLSTVNKLVSMKCDEELLSYLDHIHTIWKRIFGESTMAVQSTDNDTVRALELTCPKYSPVDRRNVRLLLEKGQIFRGIDSLEREFLWKNLMTVDCIIPSLFSFFEDAKYLLPCARNIKYVIGSQNEMTIHRALQRCFHQVESSSAQTQSIVEKEEAVYEVKPMPLTLEERFDIGRRQLWLYAMRHFAQVAPPSASSGEWRIASVGSEIVNESVLCGFASLACRLGFRNEDIMRMKQRSPEREIARRALLQARPPDIYKYNGNSFESYLDQIEKIMNTAERRHEQPDETDIWRDGGETRHRCGCPGRNDNQINKKYFFHDKILQPHNLAEGVTSLFVRKCVFLAFFGGDFVQESIEPASVQRRQKEHGRMEQQQNLARPTTLHESTEPVGQHQTLHLAQLIKELGDTDDSHTSQIVEEDEPIVEDDKGSEDRLQATEQERQEIEEDKNDTDIQWVDIAPDTPPIPALVENSGTPVITFVLHESSGWQVLSRITSNNPSEVEEVAATWMANRLRPFSVDMEPLRPESCYHAAIASPGHVIILLSEDDIHIDNEQILIARQLRFDGSMP